MKAMLYRFLHAFVQLLVSTPSPSSHSSTPASAMPSPQTGSLQALVQASVLTVLPSSHCSPACRMLSPQRGGLQPLVQLSVLTLLPSSQASTPCWTKPSPQRAVLQVLRQASAFAVFPSSHCSPVCRMPSPQAGSLHPLVQPSVLTLL